MSIVVFPPTFVLPLLQPARVQCTLSCSAVRLSYVPGASILSCIAPSRSPHSTKQLGVSVSLESRDRRIFQVSQHSVRDVRVWGFSWGSTLDRCRQVSAETALLTSSLLILRFLGGADMATFGDVVAHPTGNQSIENWHAMAMGEQYNAEVTRGSGVPEEWTFKDEKGKPRLTLYKGEGGFLVDRRENQILAQFTRYDHSFLSMCRYSC